MTTYVCPRRDYNLLLIITHWSYFKCNDMLHSLNVYKSFSNKLQVVDSWASYQMPVSEILFWKYLKYVPLLLPTCKRLKRTKLAKFKIFSYFKNPIKLPANCRINCRKTITFPLILHFYISFYIKLPWGVWKAFFIEIINMYKNKCLQ